MFQLTKVELINLKSQIATSSATDDSIRSQFVTTNTENPSSRSQNATIDNRGRHTTYLPDAFTRKQNCYAHNRIIAKNIIIICDL